MPLNWETLRPLVQSVSICHAARGTPQTTVRQLVQGRAIGDSGQLNFNQFPAGATENDP